MTDQLAPTRATPVASPWPALRRSIAVSARRTLAQPSALVVTGVFYLMVTFVLAGLWWVAANQNGGSVVGYSAAALVWYIATSEMTTIPVPGRLIEEIGNDIGSERIAIEFLRPASVLWMRVAAQIGAAGPRLALCWILGLAAALTVGGRPPNGLALALAVPSLILAVTANLIGQHTFAALAFWIQDAKSGWFIYQKLQFVLGGMLLPIEILPDQLQTVARYLPFVAMSYAPARLASGHLEPELLALQLFWIVVLGVGATVVFRSGQRHMIGAR